MNVKEVDITEKHLDIKIFELSNLSIFIANPVLVYLRVSYKTIVKDED